MESSPTTEKIAPAIVMAQSEIGRIEATSENPHFRSRYIDLASLREIIRPVLAKNDLAVVQSFGATTAESVVVETTLLHSSGEWVRTALAVPFGRGTGPQALGSSVTYGRRYGLAAMLGLAADRDDDGNTAQASVDSKPTPPPALKQLKEIPNY